MLCEEDMEIEQEIQAVQDGNGCKPCALNEHIRIIKSNEYWKNATQFLTSCYVRAVIEVQESKATRDDKNACIH